MMPGRDEVCSDDMFPGDVAGPVDGRIEQGEQTVEVAVGTCDDEALGDGALHVALEGEVPLGGGCRARASGPARQLTARRRAAADDGADLVVGNWNTSCSTKGALGGGQPLEHDVHRERHAVDEGHVVGRVGGRRVAARLGALGAGHGSEGCRRRVRRRSRHSRPVTTTSQPSASSRVAGPIGRGG